MQYDTLELRELNMSRAADKDRLAAFLARLDLEVDPLDGYVALFDGERLIAGGGYSENVIKCFGVDPAYRASSLSNRVLDYVLSSLREKGYKNLFVFTKPENEMIFAGLTFFLIGRCESAILLESARRGVSSFCAQLALHKKPGVSGSIVMNANPFTRGHQYLIEAAAGECENLHVFVVREDKSVFPFEDRMMLLRQGTAHIPNVTVHSGGDYIISRATFPTYFIKEKSALSGIHARLDADVFVRHIAPALDLTRRFVGEEPCDPLTAEYNMNLRRILGPNGIEVRTFKRMEDDVGPISASRVRRLLAQGQREPVRALVPETTWRYLTSAQAELVIARLKAMP